MIQAGFAMSGDKKSLSLTVTGHAGQAAAGQDVVCAAASILVYTAAQVVQAMYEGGRLEEKPVIRLEAGDAAIVCRPTGAAFAEALHAYTVIQTGFLLLARDYPEYIQVNLNRMWRRRSACLKRIGQ